MLGFAAVEPPGKLDDDHVRPLIAQAHGAGMGTLAITQHPGTRRLGLVGVVDGIGNAGQQRAFKPCCGADPFLVRDERDPVEAVKPRDQGRDVTEFFGKRAPGKACHRGHVDKDVAACVCCVGLLGEGDKPAHVLAADFSVDDDPVRVGADGFDIDHVLSSSSPMRLYAFARGVAIAFTAASRLSRARRSRERHWPG